MTERILVIKLSALGDFVLAFSAFAAIRAHHPVARITLLTTAPYAALARSAPWFDAIEIDTRPRFWQVAGVVRLRQQLRGFDRIYDLQTSGRSTRYFWLAGCPPWSGIGWWRRFPHRDPERDRLHTLERQRGQLEDAGICAFPRPDIGWLTAGAVVDLPRPYALLVPGAGRHRPDKRWPAERFGELACILSKRGLNPVLIGGEQERPLADIILGMCPGAVDLVGRTELATIAALGTGAALAVGNDTGPMHILAATGCRCIGLFGRASDPALTAPRGPGGAWPSVVRAGDLADLAVARVAAELP